MAADHSRCDKRVTAAEKHLHVATKTADDNSGHDGAKTARPCVRHAPGATIEELDLILTHASVDVPTAGYCLGLSRTAAYRAAKDGSLPTIRVSGRLIVPTSALARMLGRERPQ